MYRNMAQSIVDQMGGTGAARVVGEGGKMSGNIAQLIVHGKGGGGIGLRNSRDGVGAKWISRNMAQSIVDQRGDWSKEQQ